MAELVVKFTTCKFVTGSGGPAKQIRQRTFVYTIDQTWKMNIFTDNLFFVFFKNNLRGN